MHHFKGKFQKNFWGRTPRPLMAISYLESIHPVASTATVRCHHKLWLAAAGISCTVCNCLTHIYFQNLACLPMPSHPMCKSPNIQGTQCPTHPMCQSPNVQLTQEGVHISRLSNEDLRTRTPLGQNQGDANSGYVSLLMGMRAFQQYMTRLYRDARSVYATYALAYGQSAQMASFFSASMEFLNFENRTIIKGYMAKNASEGTIYSHTF